MELAKLWITDNLDIDTRNLIFCFADVLKIPVLEVTRTNENINYYPALIYQDKMIMGFSHEIEDKLKIKKKAQIITGAELIIEMQKQIHARVNNPVLQ